MLTSAVSVCISWLDELNQIESWYILFLKEILENWFLLFQLQNRNKRFCIKKKLVKQLIFICIDLNYQANINSILNLQILTIRKYYCRLHRQIGNIFSYFFIIDDCLIIIRQVLEIKAHYSFWHNFD